VVGAFNDWSAEANPLESEGSGYWSADVAGLPIGSEYRFLVQTPESTLSRNDPYGRHVTHSGGNSIVCDPAFDWTDTPYETPPWNKLVIYELHVGTFNDSPGGPREASRR
jgi:1,4-alpha-glucan branching enzyme